jgi:predicted RNA-binding Zn-ribbon protein involved in translation (DUF1610 family)
LQKLTVDSSSIKTDIGISESRKRIATMKVELQKPGQEVDESKQGRVVRKSDLAAATDEVSARAAPVTLVCPNCGAMLIVSLETDQWFRCPDCGYWILVTA